MGLYEVQTLKSYLRVDHDEEDALIEEMAKMSIGKIESYLRRPIEVREMQFVDDACAGPNTIVGSLLINVTPVHALVSVTHDDGETLNVADLRVHKMNGTVKNVNGLPFRAGPWNIVARVGLTTYPHYQIQIEPALRQAVMDLVADAFHRRNPDASDEREGGGLWVTYDIRNGAGFPTRVVTTLAPYRLHSLHV